MLKELFESSFYITFPPKPHTLINIIEQSRVGEFSLIDNNACRDCKFVCTSDIVAREQLKLKSQNTIIYVSVDQVFSYVKGSVGETCDYLLESEASLALVEMTCSTLENVVEKRPKARRQLRNTIALLIANSNVCQHIHAKKNNYAIFSWRETFDSTTQLDTVENIMKGMFAMTDVVYSPDNESAFDFDFKFREVRYPHILSL